MIPNTIEIDQSGVFCYHTPNIASVPHLTDKSIKIAKYDRVYFKDSTPVISAFVKTHGLLVEGSPYQIPDGYRIEIFPEDKEWRAGETYQLFARLTKHENQELKPILTEIAKRYVDNSKEINDMVSEIVALPQIVKDKIDIKEAKQIIAEDHGFTNWHHLVDYLCHSNEQTLLNIYIDEVIEHLKNTI